MEYSPSKSFLTEQMFLDYFPIPSGFLNISKNDFVDVTTVQYSHPVTLRYIFDLKPSLNIKKVIMKGQDDWRLINRDRIIDFFYDILVVNRDLYLKEIFRSSFELVDPRKLNWSSNIDIRSSNDPLTLSMQKNDASKVIIKNLFHIELLHLTIVTNSVKSNISFWQALTSMFTEFKIEDRFFSPSVLKLCLESGNTKFPSDFRTLYYQLQQYQPKASILNPYTVKWCLTNLLGDGKTLFTPVLSWGSYLVAFMHSNYQKYVGIDVMPGVCKKVSYLAKFYEILIPETRDKEVEILCCPSESLLDNREFIEEYFGFFDTILVCPPYFDMELYHEGEQSVESYQNYNEWLIKYWEKTVMLCYHVMKYGGRFGVIANNYNTLSGKHYPIVDDLHEITLKKFNVVDIYSLVNRASKLRSAEKNRIERLIIYTPKKSNLSTNHPEIIISKKMI